MSKIPKKTSRARGVQTAGPLETARTKEARPALGELVSAEEFTSFGSLEISTGFFSSDSDNPKVLSSYPSTNQSKMLGDTGQRDDAKWSIILDEAVKEIGLVECAKLILGRASPEERARVVSMMTDAGIEVSTPAVAETEIALNSEELAAFKAHAKAHPWKPRSGTSPSTHIQNEFAAWLGCGLRRADIAHVQENLAAAYAKDIERYPDRRVEGLLESLRNLPAGTPPPKLRKRSRSKRLVSELTPEQREIRRKSGRERARRRKERLNPKLEIY